MSAIAILLAGLALGNPSNAETAKKYRIDFSKTTSQVHANAEGMFWMNITPAPGYKVSTDAPLKIGLASEKLKLHKTKLSVKDVKDAKAQAPEFGVRFETENACKASIEVDATFFVCDDQICERKKEKVSIPVQVDS